MVAQAQILDALSTEHLQSELKQRSIRGSVWTLSSQGAQFVLQSASTVILARLLTPADFGLVAMVTAITGLAVGFADLGLSEATIQSQEISYDQLSTLFWVNVAAGLLLTLATAAMAPLLVWFYKEPRLKELTFVLSLSFLIGGLKVQHDALLRRQMRFASLAVRDVASYAVGVTAAIIMAWRGDGYWALLGFPLGMGLTRMVLSWLMVRWIPGLPHFDSGVRSMIVFGGHVAGSYVIYNANRSADGVLIGWYCGSGPLGLYSRAYNLLMLPLRQLTAPIGSVLVPAFSRLQDDSERFARYYLRAINLMAWLSSPMFAFLFVTAEPTILLLLGDKWRAAAPVFQILAISACGQLLLDLTLWSLVSRGQSHRLLRLLFAVSPIMIGSFAVGLPFGIRGVALSGSVILLVLLPWILRFSFRGTSLTLRRLGKAILCPLSLCITAGLVSEWASHLLSPRQVLPQLVIASACFVAVYSLSALIPAVRKEAISLGVLFRELRVGRGMA